MSLSVSFRITSKQGTLVDVVQRDAAGQPLKNGLGQPVVKSMEAWNISGRQVLSGDPAVDAVLVQTNAYGNIQINGVAGPAAAELVMGSVVKATFEVDQAATDKAANTFSGGVVTRDI